MSEPQVVFEKLAPPKTAPKKFDIMESAPKLAAYYGSRPCPSLELHRKVDAERVDKSIVQMIVEMNKSVGKSREMLRQIFKEELEMVEFFQKKGNWDLSSTYKDNWQLHFAMAFRQAQPDVRDGMFQFLRGFGDNHDKQQPPNHTPKWSHELVGLLTALEDPEIPKVKYYVAENPKR